jgi:hypothetical protein
MGTAEAMAVVIGLCYVHRISTLGASCAGSDAGSAFITITVGYGQERVGE